MAETLSTDGELIAIYKAHHDQAAAKALVERHYDSVYKRLRAKLSVQDAEDCTQLLWTRFFNNIENYKDDNKFDHYLSTAVTNLLKEHWRNTSTSAKYVAPAGGASTDDESSSAMIEQHPDGNVSVEDAVINSEMIDYLVNRLIPGLPAEQRLLWLLHHEAEFWDPEQPLSWDTLAQLNGIDTVIAWERFESTRNNMLVNTYKGDSEDIDPENLLVYLVWTQAQRPDKKTRFTMKYFSILLNESENTLKTRYRTIRTKLDNELTAFVSTADA